MAARILTRLPAAYDTAFRPVLRQQYDELEQEIWMELAGAAYATARDLALPTRTAKDLAGTISTIHSIFFGPEFACEALEVAPDRAVIIVKRCPFPADAMEAGGGGVGDDCPVFRRCMAFTLTAVPLLNRDFTARFVRTLCTGDRQCEIKIELKPVEEPKKKR
jgi:hypothetical protein